ncbi:MAG: 50S ribosomal protein L21 [Candidatus Eiseniibacteriota bacterium]|jgi:large subunit ribosomal protein L21
MYAVVRIQGQQLRVEPEQTVRVPRLAAEVGERLALREVLAVHDGDSLRIGQPLLDGAEVDAEVVAHPRGPKLRVFKFKRRKDYRRVKGHRSDLTELRIHGVKVGRAGGTTTASEEPASPDA